MTTLTDAGKELQATALAKALAGGSYVLLDGDGERIVRAVFPAAFEVRKVGDDYELSFGAFAVAKVERMGRARSFQAIPAGSDAPLLAGRIGPTLGKGVALAMDDQDLFQNMDFEVEGFSHLVRFTP